MGADLKGAILLEEVRAPVDELLQMLEPRLIRACNPVETDRFREMPILFRAFMENGGFGGGGNRLFIKAALLLVAQVVIVAEPQFQLESHPFQGLDEGMTAVLLPLRKRKTFRTPVFFHGEIIMFFHPAGFEPDQVAGNSLTAQVQRIVDHFRIVGLHPADVPEAERPLRRQLRPAGQAGVEPDQLLERRRGKEIEVDHAPPVAPAE